MKDDDFREDHEFEDIDKDKLDEFERELADVDKKKKNKFYVIAGGTVACAAALLYFSGWLDQPAPPKPPVKMKTADKKPAQVEPQAPQPDAEMEAVNKKNIIEEDSKAPGVVTASAPSPAKEGAPSTGSKSAPTQAEKPSGIVLQAVATSDPVTAAVARDDLNAKGFKSWISIGVVKNSLFVVEAGEFNSVKDAEPQKEKLVKAGFEPRIGRAGGKAVLVAGVFMDKAGADSAADRVKSAGLSPKVVNRKEPSDLYIVRVGPYGDEAEAKKAGESMKTAGYAQTSVIN